MNKLHEKAEKKSNTSAKRNSKNTPSMKGVYLNDKVKLFGQIGFVSGFCQGGLYVRNIEGDYITKPNKTYKQVGFSNILVLEHNNNWQFSFKTA